MGILPAFSGTAVHDASPSYLSYAGCAHALCNAHVLRGLIFLHEQHHQAWADELTTLLVMAKDLADAARRTTGCARWTGFCPPTGGAGCGRSRSGPSSPA